MNHILVFPKELMAKLNEAHADKDTHDKWLNIGIDTVDNMKERIIGDLNRTYTKLSIIDSRIETEDTIKERIENSGNSSIYAGYFENEKGCVDALFFYIEPKVESANDLLTRQVMPVIMGIYKSIAVRTKDLHINGMPVFIVSLCTTKRITQNSVKKSIVCAETMGFNYLDIFGNPYYDVIQRCDADGNPVTKLVSLSELDDFLKVNGKNEYFDVDCKSREMRILSSKLTKSSNITAELYRYSMRIIPAVYMAKEEDFRIDVSELDRITNDRVVLIKHYIANFQG